jgi:hypothetical protein
MSPIIYSSPGMPLGEQYFPMEKDFALGNGGIEKGPRREL